MLTVGTKVRILENCASDDVIEMGLVGRIAHIVTAVDAEPFGIMYKLDLNNRRGVGIIVHDGEVERCEVA